VDFRNDELAIVMIKDRSETFDERLHVRG
jgi:hypothetical protein